MGRSRGVLACLCTSSSHRPCTDTARCCPFVIRFSLQTNAVYQAMRKLCQQQQQQAEAAGEEDDEGDEKVEVKVSAWA